MKIGVSSYSFKKYIQDTHCDYIRICDLAKEMGYDGIEFIDLDNKAFGITDDPMKTAAEIREHCAAIGLDIIAYTVGAVLYGIGSKKHWMHSVFHICVVIGSLLQFFAVLLYAL